MQHIERGHRVLRVFEGGVAVGVQKLSGTVTRRFEGGVSHARQCRDSARRHGQPANPVIVGSAAGKQFVAISPENEHPVNGQVSAAFMHWETGEGRLIRDGRTLLSSDHIVIQREVVSRKFMWHAHVSLVGVQTRQIGRRSHAILELDDGRRGWFRVVDESRSLASLRSCGPFR
ncbi:hypothetical protein [Aquisalimonas sp.]|uniref:hypothetical protein n=1 Tax=Aquisalimonas sp. TaxID=1872621 RepID=UPI0025C3F9D5|nr:hypothetical protein [Aquisalimonas sp.]